MNLDTLNKYYDEGWLIKQVHPTLPLTIWNYSIATQYEGKWDEITMQCRGLVTDDKGNVVARPFKKFFNMEEGKHTPTSKFEVFDKMDGSLIIAFYIWGTWIFASRGSFTSDQAKAASKLFSKRYGGNGMNTDTTYMFEFTAPWNRIVVDYGEQEELTLLGAIRTEDGLESPWWHLDAVAQLNGIPLVKKYKGAKDYTQLKEAIYDDEEGFVIKFSNGDRMKIKGEEYLRLHKIMTNISTKAVWEVLSNGGDLFEIIKDTPDEFFDKVDEYAEELNSKFILLEAKYKWYFSLMPKNDRKKFAFSAKEVEHPAILFAMLNGKDYSKVIWRILKPKYERL